MEYFVLVKKKFFLKKLVSENWLGYLWVDF